MKQSSKIDILNICLMVISLILAINLPFKLFLFSYAILGPLHYLTEINWLSQKDFFLEDKKKFIWLTVAIGLFLTIINSIGLYKVEIPFFSELANSATYKSLIPWATNFIFILFFLAIILVFVKGKKKLIFILPALIILSLYLSKNSAFTVTFGVFLPTMIHVYLFTGFFILYGALKSDSKWGILSFFVLMSVMLVLSFDIDFANFIHNEEITTTYMKTNFHVVNYHISSFFQDFNNQNPFNLTSNLGLKVQSFIAFAYTYHYLNWFTKTTTIKWHLMKTKNAVIIICVWFFSVALYYVDYKLGVILLLYLSFLHVFLEFPLNFVSMKGIAQHLFKR